MGLRRSFWFPFFGVPRGPLGQVGARLLTRLRPIRRAMAAELDLQPDDELLDVGCGAGDLLAEYATHVRFVAGLDASEIQVGMARRRLADRLAAGSAEVVLGDAQSLPWEDGRFSVVASLNCLKFVPDPKAVLCEMHRVLRPGGRVVATICDQEGGRRDGTRASGQRDAWGQWRWSDADARRLLEEAGFGDVAVSVLPVYEAFKLVKGVRPTSLAGRHEVAAGQRWQPSQT